MKKVTEPKRREFYIWQINPENSDERVIVQVNDTYEGRNTVNVSIVDTPDTPAKIPTNSALIYIHVIGRTTWTTIDNLYELDEPINPANLYDVTYMFYHDGPNNKSRWIETNTARVIAPSEECAILRIMHRMANYRKAAGDKVESKFNDRYQWVAMATEGDSPDYNQVNFCDGFTARRTYK